MKWKLLIIMFWVVMTGWLLRYEAFPERFVHAASGYRHLMRDDVLLTESWMRITFRDTPIGYSHTQIDIDENNPNEHTKVDNHVNLRLQLMGEEQEIQVRTRVRLDVLQQLQSFEFSLVSRGYRFKLEALRVDDKRFAGRMSTGNDKQDISLEIPDDVIIYSPMAEMGLRHLKPGESMRLRTLDPASMATVDMDITALRRETLAVAGRDVEATVLSVKYMGSEILSWIDRDGNMLRQETPFGWTLEACSAEDAFAAVKSGTQRHDVLAGMAVPCSGPVENPRHSSRLYFRVVGVAPDAIDFPSDRQSATATGGLELVLRSDAERLPSGTPAAIATHALDTYLQPSQWVQSDHPRIQETARSIVRDHDSPRARALAIGAWVYENVKKEMTVSLPSALDVLSTMAGDCNEHTYLAVALARAAGLPARIMVGLAYHEGAFYYHAWPSVFVGDWLEMDPTWGQETADATHIALVEGELASQLQLAGVIGKLKMEPLRPDEARRLIEAAAERAAAEISSHDD